MYLWRGLHGGEQAHVKALNHAAYGGEHRDDVYVCKTHFCALSCRV